MEWAELLPELCNEIAKKLTENELDHVRFRLVCQRWRSSTLHFRNPTLPSLASFPNEGNPLSIIEETIYLLQIPSDVWKLTAIKKFKRSFLIKVSKSLSSDHICLKSVLNHDSVLDKRGNPIHSIADVVDILNLQVKEACREYHIPEYTKNICKLRISKDRKQAMAIDDDGQLYHYKDEWIRNNLRSEWEDIIYYRGKFVAIDEQGRTALFDSSFEATYVSGPTNEHPSWYWYWKRLVESNGELFLAEMYHCRPKVYKLEMDLKLWVEIKSLGDIIFFISTDCAFSLPASDFPGAKSDCIYYTGEHGDAYDRRFRFCGPLAGCYDLKTGMYGTLTSFPEHLKLFWPPPEWLEDPTVLSFSTMI